MGMEYGTCWGEEKCMQVGKRDRRRSLGKPRRRWEYYNKTNLREIGWDDVDWTYVAQDRRKMACSREYGNKSSDTIKCD